MYRLFIVDDEDMEREAMVDFIPWEKFDIEVVGTAWNGLDAFEQIQKKQPDIVLTDIMMPVMNGIELIKKTKATFPEIEFIVLSGYGEYEFTSQAMEEGIRHYVLKPFDEDKILNALNKLKEEIINKKSIVRLEREYHQKVRKLLPHAKSQIFSNMLLGREQREIDYRLYMDEMSSNPPEGVILAIRVEDGVDYLEQFVVENVLMEILGGENILLSTVIKKDMLLLIRGSVKQRIGEAVKRMLEEFAKIKSSNVICAVSQENGWEDVEVSYQQVQELLQIGSVEKQNDLIEFETLQGIQKDASLMLDYAALKDASSYARVLFEIYLLFLKMQLRQYSYKQKEDICNWILKFFYEVKNQTYTGDAEREWNLLEIMVEVVAEKQEVAEEEKRIKNILLLTYQYVSDQGLSIQFLCKEILYMNEEYFGRLFLKSQKQKFSTFLLQQRIELAKRLIQYNSDIKTTRLADLLGFSPDGQYFSRVFRKVTGLSPSEYRDFVKSRFCSKL